MANDSFKNWVASENDFLTLIDDKDQQSDQYSVLIFKSTQEEEITINELLVNHRLASSNYFQTDQKVEEEEQFLLHQDLPNWDPMAAEYFSFNNNRAIEWRTTTPQRPATSRRMTN